MELYFKEFGEGYPLIILHGPFGSSENWRTLNRLFAKCYRVFAVDQRNHGHSPHHPAMNYAVMARDLREFMQAHQLSSAYLVGHSMGGKTNSTIRVRLGRFLRAHYRHAGSISQTNSHVTKSRLFVRRLFVV